MSKTKRVRKSVETVWRSCGRSNAPKYHCDPECAHISTRGTYRREVAEAWETILPCGDCWETDAIGDPSRCSGCGTDLPKGLFDTECDDCARKLTEDYIDE
jgi:hypothetical protein